MKLGDQAQRRFLNILCDKVEQKLSDRKHDATFRDWFQVPTEPKDTSATAPRLEDGGPDVGSLADNSVRTVIGLIEANRATAWGVDVSQIELAYDDKTDLDELRFRVLLCLPQGK